MRGGEPFRGRMTAVAVVVTTLLMMGLMASSGPPGVIADDHRSGLPDLSVLDIHNVTPVVVGEESYFNVTIENGGSAAYSPAHDKELDIYAYRDGDTGTVVAFYVVRDVIYVGKNITINMKVRYDTQGTHSLLIVIDELDRVAETNEDNNERSFEFEVVPSDKNRQPDADGGNDRSGYLGQPMLFSGEYSTDPDGDALTYEWDFGDGSSGDGVVTNHTYTLEGEYRASLTVSDGELEDMDNFTVTITIAPVNVPPTAKISASSTEVDLGEEVTLDGRGSTDPDPGDKLVYDWDFDASDGVDDWVRGPTAVTSWDEARKYTVTLRVSDGKESDTATVKVTVKEPPTPNEKPTCNAGIDIEADKGESITFRGTGYDPDGFIESYEWDVDGDGVFDTLSTENGNLIQNFDEPGTRTLTLRVTDDRGATAEDSVVVTVKDKTNGGDVGNNNLLYVVLVVFGIIAVLIVFAVIRRRGRI